MVTLAILDYMRKKSYTVKAHIALPNSIDFGVFTLGMDGNWYRAIAWDAKIKPASFPTKIEASEFYFANVKQIKASSAFIEGPKGGIHHIVQYRDKAA